jgi:hypothetical protein
VVGRVVGTRERLSRGVEAAFASSRASSAACIDISAATPTTATAIPRRTTTTPLNALNRVPSSVGVPECLAMSPCLLSLSFSR